MRKPWYEGSYSGESIDDVIALGGEYETISLTTRVAISSITRSAK
jgi:hypothetical protein